MIFKTKQKKIFVSYSDSDKNKVEIIKKKFLPYESSYKLVIIADRRSKMKALTEKVVEGLKESDIFVPILTRNSISAQWINQEIGYYQSLKDANKEVDILPIVENEVVDILKGFIHKQ